MASRPWRIWEEAAPLEPHLRSWLPPPQILLTVSPNCGILVLQTAKANRRREEYQVLQTQSLLNAKSFTLAGQIWSPEPGYLGVCNHRADQIPFPAFAEVSP